MSLNSTTNTMLRSRSRLAAFYLRAFVATLFLGLFALSVDSVKAVSTYTDEWVDDTNPSAGEVVGCGVTYTEYYDDYHLVAVSTTITSPNGRSATKYGYGDGAQFKRPNIARAEALLAWDWNDVGTYTVNSHHWSDCPLEDLGSTAVENIVGYSRLCYRYDRYDPNYLNPNVYRVLEGCEARVSCADTYFYSVYNAGMRAKSQQGWYRIPGTSYNICTLIRVPLQSGACEVGYCEDSRIF